MASIKWIIFCCVILATIFSSGTGKQLNKQEFIEEKKLQSLDLGKAAKCDTGRCSGKCNCCPGYGVDPAWTSSGNDECKKCNCGKDFGCTFPKFTSTKTCLCPAGYKEKSGYCNQINTYPPTTTPKPTTPTTPTTSTTEQTTNETSVDKSGDHLFISLYLHKNRSLERKSKLDFHFEMKDSSNSTLTEILLRVKLNSNIQSRENNCSFIRCQNNATCEVEKAESFCRCTDKYTGKFCEIDKCSLIKCQNGGTCCIREKNAVCVCNDKFTGDFCEIDKCSKIKCRNGGICDIKDGKANCLCDDKYAGDFCEIDKCSLMRCLNGGKCENRNQKTVCVCTENFTGDFCEKSNSFLNGGNFLE